MIRTPWIFAYAASLVACALAAQGCGEAEDPPGEPSGATSVRYDVVEEALDFDSMPFPDDAFIGRTGIELGQIPGMATGDTEFFEVMRESLLRVRGFSTQPRIYFPFDGGIDPSRLPASAVETMSEDASVFLIDVDPASPTNSARVPVRVRWDEARSRLVLRLAEGKTLASGRQYAAVVLSSVGTDASPLVPSAEFLAFRDGARPSGDRAGMTWERVQDVVRLLGSGGVARTDVVALAIFTTQEPRQEVTRAVQNALERPRPMIRISRVILGGDELDAVLGAVGEGDDGVPDDPSEGVAHAAIAALVHGQLAVPVLIDERDGRFIGPRVGVSEPGQRDDFGTEWIPFTLAVPFQDDISALRVAVVVPGLGDDRGDVLGIADAFASSGYAVFVSEAPGHGMRAEGAEDLEARFSERQLPDGFADDPVDGSMYLGATVPKRQLDYAWQHLQHVVELATSLRAISEGAFDDAEWSAPELEGLGFAETNIPVVGWSIGANAALALAAIDLRDPDTSEPRLPIGGLALGRVGGGLLDLIYRSPMLHERYYGQLTSWMGIPSEMPDPSDEPAFSLLTTILDRADVLASARAMRSRDLDVLLLMADRDEGVHNSMTEAIAGAIGASAIGRDSQWVDLPRAEAPVRGNLNGTDRELTRALFTYDGAGDFMVQRSGTREWRQADEPPYERMAPVRLDNPVTEVASQLLHFMETMRSGGAEVIDPAGF